MGSALQKGGGQAGGAHGPLHGAGLILLKAPPPHPVCNGVVPIWQTATEPYHVQAHPDCH